MTSFVDDIGRFVNSEFWKDNLAVLRRTDVSFHEAKVATSVDPMILEYWGRAYLNGLGYEVRNVGHAIVGDTAYMKYYTARRPVFNLVWRYDEAATLEAAKGDPFATWTDAGEQAYLAAQAPRYPTPGDLRLVAEYFGGDEWARMVAKLRDPDIEHFHIYLLTDLHPHVLGHAFAEALIRLDAPSIVPPYYLARPDIRAMWIGFAPDGDTSFEVACYHTPGVAFSVKEMSKEEAAYGGDGWRASDVRAFMDRDRYRGVTLNEADAAVARALEAAHVSVGGAPRRTAGS
jgi:hypothetical protein